MRQNQWIKPISVCLLLTISSACTTKIAYTKPATPTNLQGHSHRSVAPGRIARQERTLVAHLTQTGAKVFHEGNYLRIVMPDNANFISNSSVVPANLMGILDYVAAVLLDYPYSTAIIHGNADNQGPQKLNQALSERRSHAVIAYLESQGIPANRLDTYGHGEHNPDATNATAMGRKRNRRVEIIIEEHRRRKG